ncbi:MAG: lipid-A-disaccharide synthase [Muribaculaceae bacterium]|nr:lipid-A-disaccharide synthase [Muribaculaceae bacterium]
MKYMMIAGEASGDLHASNVIQSLKKLDKDADIRFFGGDLMAKAAGRLPELHYERMNVMGFSEVIRKFSVIMKNFALARKVLREFRPDVLVLIDYPGFNLRMAKYAHKLGIPVHYFISPKVWAWKEWRVKKIKKYVDKMYSILPFEVAFYKNHHYDVTYVGNPSVQEIAYSLGHIPPKKHFMERQGITDPRPIIALLPGSRSSEIRNNLPLMIAAAKRFPEFQYMVGAAPAVPEKFYREVAQDPGLKVIFGATHTLLKYSAAAVVTSGTATLETALIGTPQVVVYRSNGMKLSYKIMEKLLKIKYVSLPNLIVNNSVVSELLLHECTVEGIARELSPLLQPSPRRSSQLAGYKTMQRKLGNFVASEYVAELIADTLGVQPATDNGSESPKKATKDSAESSGKSSAEDSGEQKPRPRRRKPKPKSDPQPEE